MSKLVVYMPDKVKLSLVSLASKEMRKPGAQAVIIICQELDAPRLIASRRIETAGSNSTLPGGSEMNAQATERKVVPRPEVSTLPLYPLAEIYRLILLHRSAKIGYQNADLSHQAPTQGKNG